MTYVEQKISVEKWHTIEFDEDQSDVKRGIT